MIILKDKIKSRKTNSGQVMITVVILFLLLSTSFVVGVSDPILLQSSMARDFLNSRKSYFLAESSVEDVVYRIKNNKQVFASETLSLDGGAVTTSVDNLSGSKVVSSDAANNTLVRKVKTVLKVGDGEAFYFGIQTGQGGFVMSNNATVNGNVFSNGPVTGANNAVITGSAVSASSSPSGSTIDSVRVGTAGVGDATANQVTNSTIAGNLYCQTGSGNNKSCNTSYTAPSVADFPISDASINQWKNAAEAGGVINGNYTVSSSVSLGPKKIVGNLKINGNKTLTLTGTIWVTGEIELENGATMRLDSLYGGSGGIVVTDGVVEIDNNVQFAGSGQSGSYILLLTTSDCPSGGSCGGDYAIDVSNNSNAVILNAQKGTIHLNNNAGLKEATANQIILNQGATVSYESGLTDLNFISGPAGGWNIDSWREVE